MYLKYKVIAFSFDKLPKDVFQEIFKFLPLKVLVSLRNIKSFKEHVDSINLIESFNMDEFCKFMAFRAKAYVPMSPDLNMSLTVESMQKKDGFKLTLNSYRNLKEYMKELPIEKWESKDNCHVSWGLDNASSYVYLNKNNRHGVCSIYGFLIKDGIMYHGAIRMVSGEDGKRFNTLHREVLFAEEQVDICEYPNYDDFSSYQVFECTIQSYGNIYAEDVRRIDFLNEDGYPTSFYTDNRVIAADGSFLGGKMTKSVCGGTELYGCEINTNWKCVPGKIEKKVISFSDGRVYEWFGCEIAAGGILVAGKIDKKVIIHPNGDRHEWVNCQIDAEGYVIEEVMVRSSGSLVERPAKKQKKGLNLTIVWHVCGTIL